MKPKKIPVRAFAYRKSYYLTHPWKWVKDAYWGIRNLWHRARYGFAYIDAWNMNNTWCEMGANMLLHLANHGCGYPNGYTYEEWKAHLKDMAMRLQVCAQFDSDHKELVKETFEIWDEFDDIQQYYNQEIKRIKKTLPKLSDERAASILEEGSDTSVVAFVYKIHQLVLDPAHIILIAVSATPEIAAQLFSDRVNYILNGRLEEIFDARFTYYINNIAEYFKQEIVTPREDMCPWIYTPRISDIQRLAEICRAKGFSVLTLWSDANRNWSYLMTDEIKEAIAYIQETNKVPEQYNCVITNQVMGRGMDIYDTRFQDWFCDSNEYADIAQFIRARYQPENKYLLAGTRGLIEFVRSDTHFPECYYQWHYREEIAELLQTSPIYNKEYNKQLPNWSQVIKEWGDTIRFEERKYGTKHLKQYRISGLIGEGSVK